MSTLEFKKLSLTAIVPTNATSQSAGYDLYSDESVVIDHTCVHKISTGIAIKIPPGYYGQIHIRSGHALRHNLITCAGVIDSDYRGEIMVLVTAVGDKTTPYVIQKGERFAQIIFHITPKFTTSEVLSFDDVDLVDHTGFGSTGKR